MKHRSLVLPAMLLAGGVLLVPGAFGAKQLPTMGKHVCSLLSGVWTQKKSTCEISSSRSLARSFRLANGQTLLVDQGATLNILLQQFYDVAPDMIQDGPKFMDEDSWDITGKMISTDPGQPPQGDLHLPIVIRVGNTPEHRGADEHDDAVHAQRGGGVDVDGLGGGREDRRAGRLDGSARAAADRQPAGRERPQGARGAGREGEDGQRLARSKSVPAEAGAILLSSRDMSRATTPETPR